MTMNKPHQGVVLQATPLQPVELESLGTLSTDNNTYTAKLSISNKNRYNNETSSSTTSINFNKPAERFPFWIALDEVQDPQVNIREK